MDQFRDLISIFIAIYQQFQDDRIGMTSEQVRRNFVISHFVTLISVVYDKVLCLSRYSNKHNTFPGIAERRSRLL